ncbi:MAG: hypothetical protein DI535_00055 [Citrobacter freundii]|nr:MAG: hypothetical protein DI535_00055 [Citrobacter freundii]
MYMGDGGQGLTDVSRQGELCQAVRVPAEIFLPEAKFKVKSKKSKVKTWRCIYQLISPLNRNVFEF